MTPDEIELAALNKELAWEMTKSTADVAGIIDPTPISDAISASMSLSEGDLVGVSLSLISMVPYLGDALAKSAKGAKAAEKIAILTEKIAAKMAKIKSISKKAGPAVEEAIEEGEKQLAKNAISECVGKCPLTGKKLLNPATSNLSEPVSFNRSNRTFKLEQGNASSGWKHIFDRHIDSTKRIKKSKFDPNFSEDQIKEILGKTLKHGKETKFLDKSVFEFRTQFGGKYKSYRATVNADGTIQTFHPLD